MVRRALSGALPPSRLQGGPKVQGGKITWQSLLLFGPFYHGSFETMLRIVASPL